MDHLAAYYHWRDHASLTQAALIAEHQPVDYESIEQWSRKENAMRGYRAFMKRVTQQKGADIDDIECNPGPFP